MPSTLRFAVSLVVVGSVLPFSSFARGQEPRAEESKKGSLLFYPALEVEWNAAGDVVVDTVLSIANDFPEAVGIRLYYIQGDPPQEAIFAGIPPMEVVPAEPGWFYADCTFPLTQDQPLYWSIARGSPQGCQSFTVLDPDGRPDPDGPTGRRVLRGFAVAWAVDSLGREIRWNHISGGATTIDYEQVSAWEHGAIAFAATESTHGEQTDARPNQLLLNGREYDASYDALLFEFDAAGWQREVDGVAVSADTDLTLLLPELDLRDEPFERLMTIVRYDVWNMNERRFSGTAHPLVCWHQQLFSNYPVPNNLLRQTLQTDKGKVRIHGIPQEDCSPRFLPASILGAIRTKLAFSGSISGHDATSSTLVGQGCEDAAVLVDPPGVPPGELVQTGVRRVNVEGSDARVRHKQERARNVNND